MNKLPVPDTLRELWMIKDATAQRFRTAAAYFEHLGSQSLSPSDFPQPITSKKPKSPVTRRRRLTTTQA